MQLFFSILLLVLFKLDGWIFYSWTKNHTDKLQTHEPYTMMTNTRLTIAFQEWNAFICAHSQFLVERNFSRMQCDGNEAFSNMLESGSVQIDVERETARAWSASLVSFAAGHMFEMRGNGKEREWKLKKNDTEKKPISHVFFKIFFGVDAKQRPETVRWLA